MTASTYRASGHIPRKGVSALLAAGMTAIGSALAYAWLMAALRPALGADLKYMLSAFALMGVGFWMSALARRAASVGKIRNPVWMGRAGAGLGLLAWSVQWAAYIVMKGVRDSGGEPGFSTLGAIAPFFDASIFLQCGMVFCWFIEFCVHVFPPMLAGRTRAGLPFCETSGQWAQEIEVDADFEPFADPEAAARSLVADPRSFLSMLVPCTQDPIGNHTRVTLYRCAGPESFITIRLLEEKPLESVPLPPEAINAMVAASPNAQCFWEEPVVELLRVPLPDPDALLRHWSCALDDQDSGAGGRTESARQPGAMLSKS